MIDRCNWSDYDDLLYDWRAGESWLTSVIDQIIISYMIDGQVSHDWQVIDQIMIYMIDGQVSHDWQV